MMRSVHDKVGSLVDRDLAGEVGGWLGVPVAVDNDARAAGWGEYVAGAGQGAQVLLTLTLGTGVGSSLVVGGVALRDGPGHRGVLGGHQQLLPDGPECTCGRRGCLEALASGWALPRVVAEQRARHPSSTLPADADLALVVSAATTGDPLGRAVLDELVGWWAVGIANACAVVGPDRVVLTGGLASAAPHFLDDLRRRLAALVWEPSAAPDLRVAPDVWASATLGMADQARHLLGKD
ncbi:ROK family protein [Desertihabitans brevis]|uniref:ROK family protein n=1 Tax=Desertihabitans brevis TaxID=2268447 RepID=A0A367YZ41_9ACTN|nr:ROK family protein [Desertihabitans brevis]